MLQKYVNEFQRYITTGRNSLAMSKKDENQMWDTEKTLNFFVQQQVLFKRYLETPESTAATVREVEQTS